MVLVLHGVDVVPESGNINRVINPDTVLLDAFIFVQEALDSFLDNILKGGWSSQYRIHTDCSLLRIDVGRLAGRSMADRDCEWHREADDHPQEFSTFHLSCLSI